MVKFPRRKRTNDLDGGRFWRLKIEMRPPSKSLDAQSGTHAHAASQSFVSAGLFNPIIVEETDNVIADHSILSA